jgi:hypothetical protein
MSERRSILTLNSGSSSVRFALIDKAAELGETVRGEIENLAAAPHVHAHDARGTVIADERWPEVRPRPSRRCRGTPNLRGSPSRRR